MAFESMGMLGDRVDESVVHLQVQVDFQTLRTPSFDFSLVLTINLCVNIQSDPDPTLGPTIAYSKNTTPTPLIPKAASFLPQSEYAPTHPAYGQQSPVHVDN